MAIEKKTEDKKFVKYWLKHTEAPVIRTVLGTGEVEVTIGDVTTVSYWVHESLDEEPNPFVDDEVTTGKDSKGVVDEKFWTQVEEQDFEEANPSLLRKSTWQLNTDKITDTEGVLDIEYTHEYSWNTYDGTKEVEYRVEGICTNCKWFKTNAEKEVKEDIPVESTTETTVETSPDVADNTDQAGIAEPVDLPDTTVPENTTTTETLPTESKTDSKTEKKGDDYWIHHAPHRCHRFDWRKVCLDGMCTKYKKTNYIDGKEINGNCFERNYYGECPSFEEYTVEKEIEQEVPEQPTEQVESTTPEEPVESEPVEEGDNND